MRLWLVNWVLVFGFVLLSLYFLTSVSVNTSGNLVTGFQVAASSGESSSGLCNNNGLCECGFCPSGYSLWLGKFCTASAICPSWSVESGGRCVVSAAVCPNGGSIDHSTSQCVFDVCPNGFLHGDVCYDDHTPPYTRTNIVNPSCNNVPPCPSGYVEISCVEDHAADIAVRTCCPNGKPNFYDDECYSNSSPLGCSGTQNGEYCFISVSYSGSYGGWVDDVSSSVLVDSNQGFFCPTGWSWDSSSSTCYKIACPDPGLPGYKAVFNTDSNSCIIVNDSYQGSTITMSDESYFYEGCETFDTCSDCSPCSFDEVCDVSENILCYDCDNNSAGNGVCEFYENAGIDDACVCERDYCKVRGAFAMCPGQCEDPNSVPLVSTIYGLRAPSELLKKIVLRSGGEESLVIDLSSESSKEGYYLLYNFVRVKSFDPSAKVFVEIVKNGVGQVPVKKYYLTRADNNDLHNLDVSLGVVNNVTFSYSGDSTVVLEVVVGYGLVNSLQPSEDFINLPLKWGFAVNGSFTNE